MRYWSDFTRVFYHPRSIVQINDYELGSTTVPFEQWGSGEDLYTTLDKEHDLLDRDIRPWAEECDQMQGIQMFASADDAWGGFGSRYVESLRDEYAKTPIWFWGLEEEGGQGQRTKQLLRTINTAQSLQMISSLASMYIPLSLPSYLPPYVRLDQTSQWHVSGLLSMAVESMTLPSRQKPSSIKRGLFSDIEAALNVNGNQRIADLQCSVTGPWNHETNAKGDSNTAEDSRIPSAGGRDLVYEDETENASSKLDMSFSIGRPSQTALSLRQWEKANHVFSKVGSIRGLPLPEEEIDEDDEAMSRKRQRLASLPSVEKCVHSYLVADPSSADQPSPRYYNPLPYPLLDSFPEILTGSASSGKTVAIHTSLSTTTQISKRMKGLQHIVWRMVNVADREALSNGLGEIAEAYEEGWDSGGSDEDSD